MDQFIEYGDGNPIAMHACRGLAFFAGSIEDPNKKDMCRRVYDMFMARFGSRVTHYSMNVGNKKTNFKPFSGAGAKRVAGFFSTKTEYGDAIRLYGGDYPDFVSPYAPPYNLPFFRIEQGNDTFWAEFALPGADPGMLEFAEALTAVYAVESLQSAIFGEGYFLPPANDSVAFVLADVSRRYRSALMLTAKMCEDGAYYGWALERFAKNEKAGLIDIGWKNIFGPTLAARAADGLLHLATLPGVRVETVGPCACVTLGDKPILGDVNEGEDIALYIEAARSLKAVKFPRTIAKDRFFGGNDEVKNLAHLDRFEK